MTQETPPPPMGFPAALLTATWPPPPTSIPFVERLSDRLAARTLLIALAAGMLGQLLLFQHVPGINWLLWLGAVLAGAFVARRRGARLDRADVWLPLGALVFAAFIALREDPGLFIFDFFASSALTLAAVVAIGGLPVTRSAWGTIARLGGSAVVTFWIGAGWLAHGIPPLFSALPRFDASSNSRRFIRGLLIALPLVAAFVVLFAAADAVFQNLVTDAFDVRLDVTDVVARTLFALIAGWFFAGTIVAGWLTRDRFPAPSPAATTTGRRPLTSVEAITIVGALDVLFGAFVVIQAAYLFPGADPLSASGLTYAEYARRGFFELVVVAVLSGAVILALDWLVDRATLTFRLLTAGLAAMTGVVLVSAAMRLSLYQQMYGWTELRFYVLAAIVMLAFGVLVMLATIALRRVGAVPKLVLAAGFAIALACNIIGPQAFVTAQNIERAANPALVPADGQIGLDTDYISNLSADTIPALIDARGRLPLDEQDRVTALLRRAAFELREEARSASWQSWNLSRQRALDALIAAGF